LLIDKPLGMTSRELVIQVRSRLRELGSPAVVGHCGTLDPLATGLMILSIGPATALTPWFQGGDKRYRAKFRLGVTSESLDLETPLLPAPAIQPPDSAALQRACQQLTGSICQQPPRYSAVRVQGKRAYQLARQGRHFEVPSRTVQIHRLHVLDVVWPEVEMEIDCSGGTYVRTLGDDFAQLLGTRAVMTALRRTRSSGLELADAQSLEAWLAQREVAPFLLSVAAALADMPRVEIGAAEAKRFRNGLISHHLQSVLEDVWSRSTAQAQPAAGSVPAANTQSPGDRKFPGDREPTEHAAGTEPHTIAAGSSPPRPAVADQVLVLLEDQRPVGIAYRRPRPDRADHWRIKLNLAQWLER
jgi:tRNA pseudouridine55 synthase